MDARLELGVNSVTVRTAKPLARHVELASSPAAVDVERDPFARAWSKNLGAVSEEKWLDYVSVRGDRSAFLRITEDLPRSTSYGFRAATCRAEGTLHGSLFPQARTDFTQQGRNESLILRTCTHGFGAGPCPRVSQRRSIRRCRAALPRHHRARAGPCGCPAPVRRHAPPMRSSCSGG